MSCDSLCGDFQLTYQLSWTLLCSQPLCGSCAECPPPVSNCSERCGAINSTVTGQRIPWNTLCQETWNASVEDEELRCFGCSQCAWISSPPSPPPSPSSPPETCHSYCAGFADVAMNGASAIPWSTLCQPTFSQSASGATYYCYDCPQCASISPPSSPPPPSPASPPPETCHEYCSHIESVFLNGPNAIPWSTLCQETWSSSAGGGWRCYGCDECTLPPPTAPPSPPPCLPFCEGRPVEWWRKCRWPGCSGCAACEDATPPSSTCLPFCQVNPTPWSRKCNWPGCGDCANC